MHDNALHLNIEIFLSSNAVATKIISINLPFNYNTFISPVLHCTEIDGGKLDCEPANIRMNSLPEKDLILFTC